jgi:site-specific DNA recombinase
MNLLIALYARVSSEKQVQERTIESQIESIKDFIHEKGEKLDPDLIFCDNGVSGTTLVRPALEALRDKAFSGEINQVYILSPDRLARKYAHQLILIEEFKKLNVDIIFVNKSISQTPEDQMLLQIQGVISEYEREKIVERCRRGRLHAAKKGIVNALVGAPFGYKYIKASQEKNACYEIHPTEAEVVRKCYDLFCNKQYSIAAIGRSFREQGYVSRTGKNSWERSIIWGILRNQAYIGQAEFGKTRVVERNKITKLARENSLYPKRAKSSTRETSKETRICIPVPKIIEPEIFERAKERLKENQRLSSRNNKKNEFLVGSIVRCSQCGYAMYGRARDRLRYYRCLGQDNHRWPTGRVCGARPVRVEIVDELVWDETKRLIKTPEIVMKEYINRIEKRKNEEDTNEQIIKKKNQELKSAQQEKERMLDLYQFGRLELNELEPRLQKLRAKIQYIQQEIELFKHNQEKESRRIQVIQKFEDFCSKLTTNLEELSFMDRKKILRLLVTDVIVDTTKGEIVVNHILPLNPKKWSLCTGSQ